ncbi:MAG: hypothetical protein EXR75_04125 [Myxococcales bacterium]|nr:hypothetical protein [Myxococcales bacterium]
MSEDAELRESFTLLATVVVGQLVRRIRQHEPDLVAANARLHALSRRDAVPDLFNRRHMMEVLERADAAADRAKQAGGDRAVASPDD